MISYGILSFDVDLFTHVHVQVTQGAKIQEARFNYQNILTGFLYAQHQAIYLLTDTT